MKIRVKVDDYEYMGLMKGSVHDASVYTNSLGRVEYRFTLNGKQWSLYSTCVDPIPQECRSSYCECEEGRCSGDKVDMRGTTLDGVQGLPDKIEAKKESVLDIQHGGSHYKDKGIQPIEYITANNLDFCEGNIVKYASRHKEKNGAEDIRKVIHYAQFILKFQYGEEI